VHQNRKFGFPKSKINDMDTHELKQETTFYEQVQNCKGLDLRDERGKRHELAFVLLGLTIGLLRKRDGQLSSIHRSMKNTNESLCEAFGIDKKVVISRAQLPRVLQKVDLSLFEQVLFDNYGIELDEKEKEWFSGDGKELRGSIEKGEKRGQALVQLVRHSDGEVLGQSSYNGRKESEKPCLQELISKTGAVNQKITADALHLCPAMTEPIEKAGGIFLIGLKDNQKELLAEMIQYAKCFKPINQHSTTDKGHGRLEHRSYFHYNIEGEYFDHRWGHTNFRSLFKVERKRLNLKTNEQSVEITYYISNGPANEEEDYFKAIRNHWSVEVNNHLRDVSLREDQLRTKKIPLLT
jgi:predicted transposase YbfD/YdcC